MRRHPLLFRHRLGNAGNGGAELGESSGAQFDVRFVGPLPALRRSGVDKCAVNRRGDVAQVTQQIHHLMIAEHDRHAPGGSRCAALEIHQEIHHGSYARSAVRKVADLNDRRVLRDPAAAGVDDPGMLENTAYCVEIAMDVADDDNPRRILSLRRSLRREDRNRQQCYDRADAREGQANPLQGH